MAGVVGLALRPSMGAGKEVMRWPFTTRYAKAAEDLKAKIHKKGFGKFSLPQIQKALEKVGDTHGASAQARGDLEEALYEIGVRANPRLRTRNERGKCYLLFHHNTVVAKLVDAVTRPGKDNDKNLATAARKLKL